VAEHGSWPAAQSGQLRLVQEVAWLWVQMQSRMQQHFTRLAADHSLTGIQAKVLMQLDTGGAVTMRSLAASVGYDPSNLTSVIDRLEHLGLVERRPDARDRRAKGIVLTAQGHQVRAAFWSRLVNDEGPLGALSASELGQLRTLLSRALDSAAEPLEAPTTSAT
jgi:MarR family transcriptional regulator, organic hydroperoxide resistance regulator